MVFGVAASVEMGAARPCTQDLLLGSVVRQSDCHRRSRRRRAVLLPGSRLVEHGYRLAAIAAPAVTETGNFEIAVEIAYEINLLAHGLVIVERSTRWNRRVGLGILVSAKTTVMK